MLKPQVFLQKGRCYFYLLRNNAGQHPCKFFKIADEVHLIKVSAGISNVGPAQLWLAFFKAVSFAETDKPGKYLGRIAHHFFLSAFELAQAEAGERGSFFYRQSIIGVQLRFHSTFPGQQCRMIKFL